MKAFSVPALTLLTVVGVASAQDISDTELKNIVRVVDPWVVQLRVSGTYDGKDVKGELGTGFLFRAKPLGKVMTARHVVRLDSDFDPLPDKPGEVKRRVSISIREGGMTKLLPAARTVRSHPSRDVAEVYVDMKTENALVLSKTPISANQTVIVYSWPPGSDVARPTPTRILPSQASDAPYIRIEGSFVEGESGSPILNKQGLVVGILTSRSERRGDRNYALALPVAEFQGWMVDDTASITTDVIQLRRAEAIKIFEQVIAELRKSQMMKSELVLPALDDYILSPNEDNWSRVKDSVARALDPIEKGLKLAYEYDAQLRPDADMLARLVANTKNDVVSRAYSSVFVEVRKEWNGRAFVNREIVRQSNLPSPSQVRQWRSDLSDRYSRLESYLTDFTATLLAQR